MARGNRSSARPITAFTAALCRPIWRSDGGLPQSWYLPRIRDLFGTRLRYLISGGAPLPREIFEFFSAAEVPIVEGYGLTEASPVVAVNLLGRTRPGTSARRLKGYRSKLAEDEELLIRGANVMKGYYKLEEDTRQAITRRVGSHRGYRGNRRRRIHRDPRSQKGDHCAFGRQERLSGRVGSQTHPRSFDRPGLRRRRPAQARISVDRPDFEKLEETVKPEGIDDRLARRRWSRKPR